MASGLGLTSAAMNSLSGKGANLGTFETRPGVAPSNITELQQVMGGTPNIGKQNWTMPITEDLMKMLGQNQSLVYKRSFGDQNPDYVTGQNMFGYGGQYTDAGKAAMLKQLEDQYAGSAQRSVQNNGLASQFLNPEDIYSVGMAGGKLPTYTNINITQARDSLPAIRKQFGDSIADQFSTWIDGQIADAKPGAQTMKQLPAQQKAIIDNLGKPVAMPAGQANWSQINAGVLNPQAQQQAPVTPVFAPQFGGLFSMPAGTTVAGQPVVNAGLLGAR